MLWVTRSSTDFNLSMAGSTSAASRTSCVGVLRIEEMAVHTVSLQLVRGKCLTPQSVSDVDAMLLGKLYTNFGGGHPRNRLRPSGFPLL